MEKYFYKLIIKYMNVLMLLFFLIGVSCMTNDLPYFKYHSDPLKTGMIKKEKTKCPVCNKKRDYKYVGPFYSVENFEGICPWCIKDGSAAKKYDGQFQDDYSIEENIDQEYIDELIFRTPGYAGWQQELWLIHCDEPCNFIGYVGWKEIKNIKDNLKDDINKQADLYGLSIDEFSKRLINNGSLQGYLFKSVKCGQYRLTTDCD